jgi:Stress responsive A/B Barrel Domain
MIRHITLFRWNDSATPELEQQIAAELAALRPRLAGNHALQAAPDAGIIDGNYDFAVVADFDDANSYLGYRNHPEHQEIIRRLSGPITESRVSVQYQI